MGKDSNNSGIPVFGEFIKMLNRQEINSIAEELKTDKYTKRLDSYQHLVIMLYAVLGAQMKSSVANWGGAIQRWCTHDTRRKEYQQFHESGL